MSFRKHAAYLCDVVTGWSEPESILSTLWSALVTRCDFKKLLDMTFVLFYRNKTKQKDVCGGLGGGLGGAARQEPMLSCLEPADESGLEPDPLR